jgi:putative salt-induced outer membrane protein YdiY
MKRLLMVVVFWTLAAHGDEPKFEYRDLSKPPVIDIKKPTLWKANLTLGLVWLDGNSESIGFSATGQASMKHWNNELTLNVGGAYVYAGISKYGTGGPISDADKKQAAGNWLVKLRYDRYFKVKNTVFVSFQATGDEFAGYEHRLEPQVGYARIFFSSAHQLFRGEIGYDYMHEKRVKPASCTMLPCRIFDYHNGRLFLYYGNKFTPWASFSEGLELLEAFNRTEAFRLNSLTSLSSTISKHMALKVNFKVIFNNDPPLRPQATAIDPATMMPYVYTADQAHFQKVDTQLDVVLAVTFL